MSEIQKCPTLVKGGWVNNFKKCLKFKNVPIWSEGGGFKIFKECLKFKNVPKVGRGGSTLIGTLSQIFSISYFDASP